MIRFPFAGRLFNGKAVQFLYGYMHPPLKAFQPNLDPTYVLIPSARTARNQIVTARRKDRENLVATPFV